MATAIVLWLLIVIPGTAWADTSEPVLDESSAVLSKSNLARNDTLTFSYRVTDNVACCSFALWGIYTTPGNDAGSADILYGSTSSPNRVSGSGTDGRYSYSLQIPGDVSYGTYYLKVQSIDLAGLYTSLVQIGTLTISAPSASPTPSATTSTEANSGTSPKSSKDDSQTQKVLVSNYKKVVKRSSVLKSLGISKGKKEKITYRVSRDSKKVCSLTAAGIKPKKAGTCNVIVTKTSAKKKKTNHYQTISFVR